ncbi:hypothetical protein OS493_012363 [Desmophyllum pertusum]|uniref:Uncharacterized protein n=1 Tax=Desmophyllum pertusum TaxID=174260 RepID=A0A9W9ZR81_9CNID|nr:hypothetical protein OS493_012363 [Desmophyllum pertusum]
MTVKLLKEILSEMSVPFNRTAKKADLIKMVKEARKEMSTADNNFALGQGTEGSYFATNSWAVVEQTIHCNCDLHRRTLQTIPIYYDERKERLLHLLLHLLFLLELTGKYLDVFVYLFLLTQILETIRMTVFLFEAVYSVVVLARLFKLICVAFLFASVNLASFLNDGDQHVVPFVHG